jgi:hypothetical protein
MSRALWNNEERGLEKHTYGGGRRANNMRTGWAEKPKRKTCG